MTLETAMAVPAGLDSVLLLEERHSFPSIPIKGTDLSSRTILTYVLSNPKYSFLSNIDLTPAKLPELQRTIRGVGLLLFYNENDLDPDKAYP